MTETLTKEDILNTKLRNAALIFGLSLATMLGCSSGPKKADIPSTADPQVEVSKLDQDLKTAATQNIDVLASGDYRQSQKYLGIAKNDIEHQEKQSESLDALRTARGYLQKAYDESEGRSAKAEGLFAARQMAMKAGANQYSQLSNDLSSLDNDVIGKADHLGDVSTEKLASYQQRYVDLERRAVILGQLGKAQALVSGSQNDGAKNKAPVTFKKAELSLKTAESVISTNVRNPEGYKAAVAIANKDANQLMNVMKTIEQNGKISESVAVKMVSQNKAISALNTDLDAANAKGEADQSAMQRQNDQLASAVADQNAALNKANGKVQVQRALEQARSQFSTAEAEAYQQGDNLVIRLKQVNFASGRSDLPAASLPLLAKVSDVAKSLRASEIKVEGHTDSVGTNTENKAISEKRASAVASYLKSNGFADTKVDSEGFGFEKPIATNKTKAGRAQNRRVDIIITPETSAQ